MSPEEAYQLRFGKDKKLPYDQISPVIEQQLLRRTKRYFTAEPLEDGLLEMLVAAAQCSATSGGLQTYSVIALSNKDVKDLLLTNGPSFSIMGLLADPGNIDALRTCSALLIWVADLNRTSNILNEGHGIDPLVIDQPNTAEYHLKAIIDTAIVSQSFSICAESMGLGVMYWGGLRYLPKEFLKTKFNLPHLTLPLFGMIIGYPHNSDKSKIHLRFNTDTVLHYKTYNDKSLGDFPKRFEDNWQNHRPNHKTFLQRVVERLQPAQSKSWVSATLNFMGFTFK